MSILTNAEYAHFLAHGFDSLEHHRSLLKDLGPRGLHEAKLLWRDETNAPGPLTWKNGTFPSGCEHEPVSGISFYEAAACASFHRARLLTEAEWEASASPAAVWQWTTTRYVDSPGPERYYVYDLSVLHRVAKGGPIPSGALCERFPLHPLQRFAGLGARLARSEDWQ